MVVNAKVSPLVVYINCPSSFKNNDNLVPRETKGTSSFTVRKCNLLLRLMPGAGRFIAVKPTHHQTALEEPGCEGPPDSSMTSWGAGRVMGVNKGQGRFMLWWGSHQYSLFGANK